MSIFRHIFGNKVDSTKLAAELAATADELAATVDELVVAEERIAELSAAVEELENKAPEIVEIQVPVPQEVVTVVVVQLQNKATCISPEQYASFEGLLVSEFITQLFPSADLDSIAQISLVSSSGENTTLRLDEYISSEVPCNICISQTSGRGEAVFC